MAKLYFRYGAMNSGKSTILQQVAHNYDENNKKVIVIKPGDDTKGNTKVTSRIGLEREADYIIYPNESIFNKVDIEELDCILVDEAQFFTANQITELFVITKMYDIPVICYGIRTDYKTNLFTGSERLLALADEIEEIKTICSCGKAARFHARYDKTTGEYVKEGEQILIDDESQEKYGYKTFCGKCYIEKVGITINDTLIDEKVSEKIKSKKM